MKDVAERWSKTQAWDAGQARPPEQPGSPCCACSLAVEQHVAGVPGAAGRSAKAKPKALGFGARPEERQRRRALQGESRVSQSPACLKFLLCRPGHQQHVAAPASGRNLSHVVSFLGCSEAPHPMLQDLDLPGGRREAFISTRRLARCAGACTLLLCPPCRQTVKALWRGGNKKERSPCWMWCGVVPDQNAAAAGLHHLEEEGKPASALEASFGR